jgi:hypothetical protein
MLDVGDDVGVTVFVGVGVGVSVSVGVTVVVGVTLFVGVTVGVGVISGNTAFNVDVSPVTVTTVLDELGTGKLTLVPSQFWNNPLPLKAIIEYC